MFLSITDSKTEMGLVTKGYVLELMDKPQINIICL